MQSEEEAAEDVAAVVARRVRALREAGRFSVRDLSAELAALGHRLLPSVVSRIENGDRRVDVTDLIALALALQVSPAEVLVDLTGDPIQITPDVQVAPAELLLWIFGLADLPDPLPVTFVSPTAGSVRQLWTTWIQVEGAEWRASQDEVPDMAALRAEIALLRARLADRADEVTRRSVALPRVVAEYLGRTGGGDGEPGEAS